MAQTERAREEGRASKRERAREKRATSRREGGSWQWELDQWWRIRCLTETMASKDGAIRVGLTRDGGALALGMYMGDDYATEYIRPNEDFDAAMREIAAAWLPDKEAVAAYLEAVEAGYR